MSYEDVDEIKTQLHDAYTRGCEFMGAEYNFDIIEEGAFETAKYRVIVKFEVKK